MRIIDNPDAYVVSPKFAAAQVVENQRSADGRRLIEIQAKRDEAWLDAKMEEFRKGMGLHDTRIATRISSIKTDKLPITDKNKIMEELNETQQETKQETKKCSVCGQVKPLSEYHTNRRNKDGLQVECKECRAKQMREYNERKKIAMKEDQEREAERLAAVELARVQAVAGIRADTQEAVKATERQVGGDHYKGMAIQPIEFIQRNGLGFCEGNVVKYVCRHAAKNGKEDLLKAKHYIDLLIELNYPER